MGKALNHVGLAALVAAGLVAYFAKPVSTRVETVGAGYSSGVVVTDRDGYFVVTLGEMPMILSTEFIPG